MRIETQEYKTLTADAGKYLYNAKEGVICVKVHLGKSAPTSDWVEITEADKQRIEAEQAQAE